MKALKVLVVDDSALAMRIMREALHLLGHEMVASVQDGAGVVEAYKTHQPDLVTMDVTMHGVDGIAATRLLLQEFPDARVIMVTSHRQQETRVEAMAAGARGYLVKPLSMNQLEEQIGLAMRADITLPDNKST